MKALTGNFSTHSTQDWLQKAEKDLKGKSLDELSWSWDDTLAFSPAYFDAPNSEFKLPTHAKAWSITEPFVLSAPAQTNTDILEALNMGAEHISVTITSALSEAEWAKLFDKVVFDYIQITLVFKTDAGTLVALDSYLQKNDWTASQFCLIVHQDIVVPDNLVSCRYIAAELTVHTSDSAQQLALQLRQAEQLLQNSKGTPQMIFNIHLNKSFYHNIAWIQAAQIIWQNILHAHQMNPTSPILMVAHIQDSQSLDENTQKINATIQAISAVVSGVQSLIIHPQATAENSAFERRINRNIQHLMKLESYMDQVMNPTEGAYYFDHLTKELAERAWTSFQELD